MFCSYCGCVRSKNAILCPDCGASLRHVSDRQSFKEGTTEKVQRVPDRPHTAPLQAKHQFSPSLPFSSSQPSDLYNDLYEFHAPDTDPLLQEQQSTLSLQLVPDHVLTQLLPEQTGKHAFVAIPPLYTRPRPLIPTHRIISGLLSVLIVCALLCSGSIYYVQASGLFAKVSRIYLNTAPKNIPPTVWAKLPDPPEQTDKDRSGPALAVIPSATTTDRYDPKTYMALSPQTKFMTQQTIYLTFSVQTPKQDGKVIAKWYTNNKYFLAQTSDLLKVKDIPSGSVKDGVFTMRYLLPAEGKVELYWNNQWAQTLYFVVNT